jgi:hypothetical protein
MIGISFKGTFWWGKMIFCKHNYKYHIQVRGDLTYPRLGRWITAKFKCIKCGHIECNIF